MMQEDATYMNLFVVYQFYKIKYSNSTLFKIVPLIFSILFTFHLFSSSIFSNLGIISVFSSIQKRFFLCSINLRSIPIDLYKLIFNESHKFEKLSCCTLLKSFHKDFREMKIRLE